MLEIVALMAGLAQAGAPLARPPAGPSFSLDYRAAPNCPNRAQFEAAILARAPEGRSSGAESAQVRFEAELGPGEKGRLRATLDDGSSQDREIEADDCFEAAQTMAVIAAMILSSRVPAPASEPRPQLESEPSQERQPKSQPTALPAPARPRGNRVEPASRKLRPTWLAASAGVGIEGSAAPSPALAVSASAELGRVTGSVLAPSLRLSALFGQAADATTAAGNARFRLVLGRVHACGVRLGKSMADLRVCAVADGGVLFASGINALNERSDAMPWLAAGLGTIAGLRVTDRVALELSGSIRALMVRDQFVFAPGTMVFQPPVIAGDFRLGVSCRAW